MIDYKSLAKTAAVNFIKKNIPLNETIEKLAQNFNLNPTQIQRVAEFSNKATHQYCLIKMADKNFTFDLADTNKILENLSNNNYDKDLISDFKPEKMASINEEAINELFQSPEKDFDVKLAFKKIGLEKFAEKLEAAIKEVDARIVMLEVEKAAESQDLKTQITHLKNNGIQPEDIRQTLVIANPVNEKAINKAMKGVGVEPASGTKSAPAEKAPILNQQHPVVIRVKNIMAKDTSITNVENAKKYLINQQEKLQKHMRNYS
jgi:hypothetical protein